MEHTGFPSEETLAAFIDGRLDDETRKRVVEHMADCAECRDTYLGSTELVRHTDFLTNDSSQRRTRFLRASATIGLAAAIAIGVFLPARLLYERYLATSSMTRFVEAANELPARPVEARFSVDFAYKRLAPTVRGGASSEDSSKWTLLGLAGRISKQAETHSTIENLQALGVSAVVIGKYDVAVSTLEKAVKKETSLRNVNDAITHSDDAKILVDLSGAYLARSAQEREHADDVFRANEVAARAYALDSKNPAVLWNRALALERLGLDDRADQAWREYLSVDPGSAWAAEATAHLQRSKLHGQAVDFQSELRKIERGGTVREAARIYPQQLKQYAEEDLLGLWAAAVIEGASADSDNDLVRFSAIGSALVEITGDHLLSDTATFLRGVSGAKGVSLARVHLRYSQLRSLAREKGTAEVIHSLEQIQGELSHQHSPFLRRVGVRLASAQYDASHFEAALDQAETLTRSIDCVRDPITASQIDWLRGLCLISMGRPDEALDAYNRARTQYERIGDRASGGSVRLTIAETRKYLGEEDIWPDYLAALQDVAAYGEPSRLPVILNSVARALRARGLRRTAEIMNVSAIDVAERLSLPQYKCEALIAIGGTSIELGLRRDAQAALASAEVVYAQLRDAAVKDRLIGDLDVLRATLGDGAAEINLKWLDDAVAAAQNRHDHFRLARFLLSRGRAHLRDDDARAAESDFRLGIDEVEQQRRLIGSPLMRAAYFDTAQSLYRELVSILIMQKRTTEAMEIADGARARSLLDSVGRPNTVGDRVLVSEIVRVIPVDTTAVEFFSVGDHFVAFVVRRSGLSFFPLTIDETTVRAWVERIRDGSLADSSAAATDLFLQLLDPLRSEITPARTLLIVTDGSLGDVPFSSLVDPVSRTPILEGHAVAIIPSLRVLVESDRLRAAIQPTSRVLVLADPNLSGEASASLPPLPGARREAAMITDAFSNARVATGERATPAEFLKESGVADIVHFGCHASIDESAPQFSGLLLSGDDRHRSGRLYANEIASANLRRISLVVLAACNTRAGRESAEGTLSLAHAFLQAGVGSVLATLRPVDDATSSTLLAEFYSSLISGATPAEALRTAQLRLRQRNVPGWASFQIYSASWRA